MKKCIFIHNPRTAGTYALSILQENNQNVKRFSHNNTKAIKKIIGNSEWQSSFKIAFVRNPWERLVSWYFYHLQSRQNTYPAFQKLSFDEFVRLACLDNETEIKKVIFENNDFWQPIINCGMRNSLYQFQYMQGVDYVGRFENFHNDFKKIGDLLGFDYQPGQSVNASKHDKYQKYYSMLTEKMVAEKFKEDINIFDYQFDRRSAVLINNKNKKLKVLLVSLYDKDALGPRALLTALQGAGYSDSFLIFLGEKNNHNEKEIKNDFQSFLQVLKFLRPDVVGISILSAHFRKLGFKLVEAVKANSVKLVVVGGQQAIINPDVCIDYADAVCVGDGNRSMIELADMISQGKDYCQVGGFWFKKGNQIMKRLPNTSLDAVPSLRYFKKKEIYINDGKITSYLSYKKFKTASVMCSVGCPFDCSYCLSSVFDKILKRDKRVVNKPVDKIISELKYLKSLGVRYFQFADRIFPWQSGYINEFCRQYKKEVDLPFIIYVHANLVKRDIMADLASAGLKTVIMGVQTGSEKARKEIYNRTDTNQSIIEASNIFHQLGIKICYDFMIDNPYETDDDCHKSLDFFINLKKPFIMNVRSLIFMPKTSLTERAIKEYIIPKNFLKKPKKSIFINSINDLEKANIMEKDKLFLILLHLTQIKFLPKIAIKLLELNKLFGIAVGLQLLRLFNPRVSVVLLR